MRVLFLFAGLVVFICGCNSDSTKVAADRDNTAVNERDAEGPTVTPVDQSNTAEDIDQVAEIRSRVLKLEDLSVNGRNVKIITDHGKAVLRGPVASEAEREAIAKVAAEVVGDDNVDNQLEVEKQ